MIDIKIIADEADMIVNGYAFKRCKEGYSCLLYTSDAADEL